MTRELTLTDIAGYLPHKLQLFFSHYGEIETANIWNLQGAILTNFKPVLRPMSDRCVEITDKDYNGGKLFVPIVELANLVGESKIYQWKPHSDGRCAFSPEAMDYFRWLEEEKSFIHSLSYCGFSTGYVIFNQHEMYDLLHRLHFDYRGLIDAGLAVSVHDLKRNPYEAANN